MKIVVVFASGLLCAGLLAACAATQAPAGSAPPASSAVTLAVTAIQVFYPDLKADAAIWVKSHPSDAKLIAKIETALDPEVAALSGDSAPATVQAAIADIENQVNALPTTVLSAAHQQELDIVLGFSSALATFGSAAAPVPLPAGDTVAPFTRHFVRT